MPIKGICVFGASAVDLDPVLYDLTKALGEKLGNSGYNLVFGGFARGLMQAIAEGFEKSGAEIIGVVPSSLMKNRTVFPGCTDLIPCDRLEERKRIMMEKADAFITVPGGIGTLDEFFGLVAQRFIGESQKPNVLYSPKNFYAPLHHWLQKLEKEGIIYRDLKELYLLTDDPQKIIAYLRKAEEAS